MAAYPSAKMPVSGASRVRQTRPSAGDLPAAAPSPQVAAAQSPAMLCRVHHVEPSRDALSSQGLSAIRNDAWRKFVDTRLPRPAIVDRNVGNPGGISAAPGAPGQGALVHPPSMARGADQLPPIAPASSYVAAGAAAGPDEERRPKQQVIRHSSAAAAPAPPSVIPPIVNIGRLVTLGRFTDVPLSLLSGFVLHANGLLGKGRHSVVYRGRMLSRPGQFVALKIIDARGMDVKKEVKNEIVALNDLDPHRNITQLQGVRNVSLVEHGCIYCLLVFDFAAPGYDMFTCLELLPMEAARLPFVWNIFKQLVEAVRHCHAHGWCHMDIKPDNIVLRSSLTGPLAVLIDFGFASRRDDVVQTFLGTVPYSAPELLLGKRCAAPPCDIWSLAATLYVMLTHNFLWGRGGPVSDVFSSILAGRREEFPQWFSPNLVDLLDRMLVFDPQYRCTLNDVLAHPWMQTEPVQESPVVLDSELRLLWSRQ